MSESVDRRTKQPTKVLIELDLTIHQKNILDKCWSEARKKNQEEQTTVWYVSGPKDNPVLKKGTVREA